MGTNHTVIAVASGAAMLVGLCGCSTPQAALDQANHSSKLVSLLDIQLQELRRVERASEQSQQDALAAQRDFLSRLLESTQLSTAASKSAGDTQLAELTKRMTADADAIAANRDSVAASTAAYAATLAALLKPLPDSAPAIAEAQTKLAAMGTELDRETRLNELVAFAKDIKKSVDDNKAKIKDAEKAAASAAAAAASGAAGAKLP
jgi:hypothetical protein